MKFKPFSQKQLAALTWWCPSSPHKKQDAIICDGAVRSGKTLCLSLSFVLWAFAHFHQESFAICGKTVSSLGRNLLTPLLGILTEMGMDCCHKVSKHTVEVNWQGRQNHFYLFGGKDEGSAALIQGTTLAGILLDEVALMPRSFVEQALARCSVEGSKFWFNCNPDHPGHWFYREWIRKCTQKNAYYLHFTMADNPSLSDAMQKRYQTLYSGIFYERFVLGRWTAAHGAVYPMFAPAVHVVESIPHCSRFLISCDYGTVNPCSMGLWGQSGATWYRIAEYYHSSRASGKLLTDEEYADAMESLAAGFPIEAVIVDPSASSFIQCLRRRGHFSVVAAQNQVMDGVRLVAGALKNNVLRIHASCQDCIREFGLYRWNLSAPGDVPQKEHDHAMDDLRYFAMYALHKEDTFFVGTVSRS